MEAPEPSVCQPDRRRCGRVLRCVEDEGRYTHHGERTDTMAKSTVSRRKRKTQVPVAVGRGGDRRVTIVQIPVKREMESPESLKAFLSSARTVIWHTVPKRLRGPMESVLSARQRRKIGGRRAVIQRAMVYPARWDVREMVLIPQRRDPDPRQDQRSCPLVTRGRLLDLAAYYRQLYTRLLKPGGDADLQGDGA